MNTAVKWNRRSFSFVAKLPKPTPEPESFGRCKTTTSISARLTNRLDNPKLRSDATALALLLCRVCWVTQTAFIIVFLFLHFPLVFGQVERISDKLSSLRSRNRHIIEENRRYAGYVLSAAQSLRHMVEVVESSDASFSSNNRSSNNEDDSKSRKDKRFGLSPVCFGHYFGTQISPTVHLFIVCSGELSITVSEAEVAIEDLQDKVAVILATLFPPKNAVSPSQESNRSVCCSYMHT